MCRASTAWGCPLLRNVGGGDLSPRNLALAGRMLDILERHRAWLYRAKAFVPVVLYAFLRLAADHAGPALEELRTAEIRLCAQLLTDRFDDCLALGRELLRALAAVGRVPELEAVWRDMLHNPQALSPAFQGVASLLQVRTPRRLLITRLSAALERNIYFFLQSVRQASRKRYLEWLQKQVG
jgi:integrator complex subunit 3